MPEGRVFHGMYLGELFWSPAYRFHDDPYMGNSGWQEGGSKQGQMSKPILPLSETYNVEHGTFDCSIDEGFSIRVPAEQLVHGMGLHWNGVDGCFFDKTGHLTAFDPSVKKPGPSVLLIRRDAFLEFLEEKGYAIVWTLLGEKGLTGGLGTHSWQGDSVVYGSYRLSKGQIAGKLMTKFRSPT